MPDKIKLTVKATVMLPGGREVVAEAETHAASDGSEATAHASPPVAHKLTAPRGEDGFAHSRDFASVRWRGRLFSFTPTQRAVVACLFEAWTNGTPHVAQLTLLDVADCTGTRLRDVFRRSPAWGELIVSGILRDGPAGSYCLDLAA